MNTYFYSRAASNSEYPYRRTNKMLPEIFSKLNFCCTCISPPPPPEVIPSQESIESDPYSDRILTSRANQAANRLTEAKGKLTQQGTESSLQPSQHLYPDLPKLRGNGLPDHTKSPHPDSNPRSLGIGRALYFCMKS